MNMEIFKRPLHSLKNERGFTLVELLTVVAIIAIIGGGMIAAFDGLEDRAAAGTGTGTIASLESVIRTFAVVDGQLPDNLESLLAAVPGTVGTPTGSDCTDLVDAMPDQATRIALDPASGFVVAEMIPSKLRSKITPALVTERIVKSLVLGGITKIRFLELAAEAPTGIPTTGLTTDIPAADCATNNTYSGPVREIDIPMHAFEAPQPGLKNRGRGWNMTLVEDNGTARSSNATNLPSVELAFWAQGPVVTTGTGPTASTSAICGYDCVKVGAKSTDTLVVMGIGQASTLVGSGSAVSIANAPYYAKVLKHEYAHYAMLIWVDNESPLDDVKPARLIAIIDSRGDFLEEEYTGTTGQNS